MRTRGVRIAITTVVLAFLAALCPVHAAEGPEGDPKKLWVYRESVALGVPEKELEQLVDECRARGFIAAEVQRMLGLIARAKLAGLPHRDLLFKLREGLAKNASPELIDAALAQKAQNLKKSKGLVDGLIVEGYVTKDYELAIQIVGDAFETGMTAQEILQLIRRGEKPPPGMPDPSGLFLRPDSAGR